MRSSAARRRGPAGEHRSSALVTLTSDFGLHDPYVGIMKARILRRAPRVSILDLTHEITPFQPEEAGYWLWCCYTQFDRGTVHVAVVDPGVGSERAIIVLQVEGQRFIAPDNGLLGLIAQSRADALAVQLDSQLPLSLGFGPTSATFHGRDIMAPLAAELALDRLQLEQLGPRCTPVPGRLQPAARAEDGSIRGAIAVIDHFGNGLTTIPATALGEVEGVQLELRKRRFRLVRTYEQARPGECVGLINSSSMLELAVRQGSAAAALGLHPGIPVRALVPR
jgi:S-adenosylmethionine hydrolase